MKKTLIYALLLLLASYATSFAQPPSPPSGTPSVGTITGLFTGEGDYLKSDGTKGTPSGSMTYPGAGVPNSTGSAWGTSYTVGTSANNLVQLDATGKLPAVDGSQLTGFFSGSITDEQLLCGENTDGVNRIKSCGAKSVDNSTASHVLSKDNSGEIENLTLDNHLSLTGTTSPTLSVVTPTIDGSAHVHLTAAQMAGNGVIVTNYGQTTADVVVGLPAAASGLSGLFTVATAQSNHWGVQADTNDKIYLIAAAGTVAAGSDGASAVMVAAQLGQSFACWTFQSGDGAWDWMCKAISIGTSTFEAHAAM